MIQKNTTTDLLSILILCCFFVNIENNLKSNNESNNIFKLIQIINEGFDYQ